MYLGRANLYFFIVKMSHTYLNHGFQSKIKMRLRDDYQGCIFDCHNNIDEDIEDKSEVHYLRNYLAHER